MRKTASPQLTRLAAIIREVASHSLGRSALFTIPAAFAGPGGEQVMAGNVGVARPDALHTQVSQSSQNAVVNWQSFNVGGQEYVQFIQPGTTSAILNRVVGGGESDILGHLDANGRVFLVNPQGVYFAPGAKVDTAGFAASALDITDRDFMAGRYVFGQHGAHGAVTNQGEIKADQFVVLMGEQVSNEGLIQAQLGTVVLAAGSATTLQVDDTGLVNFAVDEKAVSAAAGVKNVGQIIADGGRVLMTAKVADDLVKTAVNNQGLVRAASIEEHGGEIFLRASGGDIVNGGELNVAGTAGHSGGRVVVKGDKNLDVEAGGAIIAHGDGPAAGGSIRLIADGKLELREGSSVDARGGAQAGHGGEIELSAKRGFKTDGNVEVGRGGLVLIDPSRLEILNDSTSPRSTVGSSSLAIVGKGFIEQLLNSSGAGRII